MTPNVRGHLYLPELEGLYLGSPPPHPWTRRYPTVALGSVKPSLICGTSTATGVTGQQGRRNPSLREKKGYQNGTPRVFLLQIVRFFKGALFFP